MELLSMAIHSDVEEGASLHKRSAEWISLLLIRFNSGVEERAIGEFWRQWIVSLIMELSF
jgi:hypothetical protein